MLACKKQQIFLVFILVSCLDPNLGSGFCATHVLEKDREHGHQCDHGHHHHDHRLKEKKMLLPEELAEEEDLKLYAFGPYYGDDHVDSQLLGLALWVNALGCSLLVSLASLICLILLPVIFIQGKPSKADVDSLALFGAGAMLGDAFLHQLPHAFGGEKTLAHDHHEDHPHQVHAGHGQHSHSLQDLFVGISVLGSWQVDEISQGYLNGDNLGQHETLLRRRKMDSVDGDVKSETLI